MSLLRSYPRRLTALALAIVALHVLNIVWAGDSAIGALWTNILESFSAVLAAFYCFRASRKVTGFGETFWKLVGAGVCTWAIANVGWAYFEVALRAQPPVGSLIRFLFDTQGMFAVMALFLNQERTGRKLGYEEYLDFAQIGILFFFVYFSGYYLPAKNLSAHAAMEREATMMTLEYAGIALLALLQWQRARSPLARQLYGGLTAYVVLSSTLGTIGMSHDINSSLSSGSWYDLAWTIPLLFAAFWAATWTAMPGVTREVHRRDPSLTEIIVNNAIFVIAPFLILYQVIQLGPEWNYLRFGLLALSLTCYALRIGITQYNQIKNAGTIRRQMLAMDSSSDGMAILSEKGVHVYANAAFATIFGFANVAEVVGKHWTAVYADQLISRLENPIRESLRKTGKWSSSFPLKRAEGGTIPVEFSVAVMADGSTACVCRDLSRHEEAQKAREEAETKFQMIVEHVNAISYIAEIGIDGQWYYVSPQIESILGYTADEWLPISSNWASMIHPEDLPIVSAAEQASMNGLPFQAEFRVRRKDGREVWLSDTATVVRGSDPHPVMEGVILDITERKALETQLQQSRKMEAIGRLAGGIAHDFNNLLTIISGYTDLAMSRTSLSAEIRNDIERIDHAAGRAAALVRQLLAFSRKQVLQPKILDLNSLVLNLDKLLRRLIDDNIEMVTRTGPGVSKVKADPAQLEQVLMNLVVNARDAMPDGGRIIVETSNIELDVAYSEEHVTVKPGRYVMLTVTDNGVGMSRQTLSHIFEPFYTTKASGAGTGLGLSTVYGIVKQSGGYIWVNSEPGKGSTFKVYLPLVEEAGEATVQTKTEPTQERGSETVLLVEDEEAVRDLIEAVLMANGYRVIAAADPKSALARLASCKQEIHMLLTDVVMPGMSGRELAAQVCARFPGIRVLFMSGYSDNVITTEGMLEKGLAFLQKPFSPSALIQKVHEVLSQTPAV